MSAAAPFKYRAFISYRHKDKVWGDWLHKALESYRVPRELAGQPGKDGVGQGGAGIVNSLVHGGGARRASLGECDGMKVGQRSQGR